MNVDRYTKFVLTIIATCLILLVLKSYDIVPDAYAAGPIEVEIVGCSSTAFYMAEPISVVVQ
jgi:hypothetical protein